MMPGGDNVRSGGDSLLRCESGVAGLLFGKEVPGVFIAIG